MKLRLSALTLSLALGCSHPHVSASHFGWTVRYAHHTGSGDTDMLRGTHPDIIMAVLDGRGRFINETGPNALLDHATGASQLCRGSQCVPSTAAEAIAVVNETTALTAPAGATDTDIAVEFISESLEVADLHTDGARFTGAVRHSGGSFVFTVEVHWIDHAGDPTVEVAKDFFVAPLVRLGANKLVAAIRRTVGLPLMFDVRIVNAADDADHTQGEDVYRAISVGNPPPAL